MSELSPIWTDDELQAVTGYKHHARQIEELRNLGIDVRVRSDGYPVVLRAQNEPTGKRRVKLELNNVA